MYFVYIVTNKLNSVFYIGITNNLVRRINEHINGSIAGFTKKYNLKKIIHFESFMDVRDAIMREKQLKNWHRAWKINLIQKSNPDFRDLTREII
jgi:putative endonuclease